MQEFFKSALDVVNGNDGVIPIVVMFVFSTIVTIMLSKTIKLNQKQSYGFLSLVFIGLMGFLIVIYAMFLKPNDSNTNNTNIENSFNNNTKSNLNVKKDNKEDNLNITNSASGNSNSTIIMDL